MNHAFIETANTKNFNEICDELASPSSLIGPSIALVISKAGRGKSEAAKHYCVHTEAIYIPPMNVRSPAWISRDIAFELAKVRPNRTEACLQLIGSEISKKRRLVIIDEADLLDMKVLEMLRNINERCSCPMLWIGEEGLINRVISRERITSRIRRRMEFGPLGQHDIAFYLRQTFSLKSASPEIIAPVNTHAAGDWRPVLRVAVGIDRAMNASNTYEITPEIVKNAIEEDRKNTRA